MLKEYRQFIQIPGPNPILRPGEQGSWDEGAIEACNVFKDGNTYYLYYHGNNPPTGYRIGVATAPHPLGPWKKYEKNPIVDFGSEGGWEDIGIACAAIIKEGENKYYMWYSGKGKKQKDYLQWDIGLATASHPLGPWKKWKNNPILEDFGYIGGVVRIKGKYHMYSEYPIEPSDLGGFALATADSPEGPWIKYEGNPVLSPDDWGAWDDGGFSEAGVIYHGGMFHMFYGGAKRKKLESVGYAHSNDGYHFTKYSGNPVALREKSPDASAFAEIHALWEPPFYYLYHTLRYVSRGGMYEPNVKVAEDIGVQVLATATPFQLAMPIINIGSLKPGVTTSLQTCPSISFECIHKLAITVKCTYHNKAKKGLRVHLKASYDGIHYDTEDLYGFDNNFKPGKTISKTVELNPKVMFIKVSIENLDKTKDIVDVKLIVTLGGA